ncbi:YcgJ family protein [Acinetobacter sp.]|uniref:YcgJ family protein n=1 Tax=Acinetobacter sp. TaxID=472 RepID=UPI002FC926DC
MAVAKTSGSVFSPKKGVICDAYICADQKGVSKPLTVRYLGKSKANRAFSQGSFDVTAFTLSNGVFCDTKTKLCHADRYFDQNGKRSKVDKNMTDKLFQK